MLNDDQGKTLLQMARAAIARELALPARDTAPTDWQKHTEPPSSPSPCSANCAAASAHLKRIVPCSTTCDTTQSRQLFETRAFLHSASMNSK